MAPEAAPEALQSPSEDHFRVLVEGLREYAFYMLDPSGVVVSWNAGAQRIKGFTADEIIGRHFSAFFPPHDVLRGKPEAELKAAVEKGVYEEEAWRVRKDGTEFWASVVITALYDREGRHAGFAKLTRDFSERRAAREELQQSEERFRLFTDAVKDYALFQLDPNGHVMSWNVGAQRLKGYAGNEIIGHHFSRFYTPEDIRSGHPEHELRIAVDTGRYEEEGLRVRKDGTRFWANVVISPLLDRSGKLLGFAKVTRDVTDRKQTESALHDLNRTLEARVLERTSELKQTVARLESLLAEKDVLMREIQHRVKNNLQVVTGLLGAQSKRLPQDQQLPFDVAVDRIRAISRVHDRLSAADNAAAIAAGDFATDLCRDLADAYGVSDRIAFEIDVGGVTLDLDTGTPVALLLNELVANAVKHAFPQGRPGRIRILGSERDGSMQIAVSDDGVGLPPDFEERKSLGFGIVAALTRQIDGTLTLGGGPGTEAVLRWPAGGRSA